MSKPSVDHCKQHNHSTKGFEAQTGGIYPISNKTAVTPLYIRFYGCFIESIFLGNTRLFHDGRGQLVNIESDLLTIEEQGEDIDLDLVNKVFRAAHSIKGGAGFLNLNTGNRLPSVYDLEIINEAQTAVKAANRTLIVPALTAEYIRSTEPTELKAAA